jgi:hypothetical protein
VEVQEELSQELARLRERVDQLERARARGGDWLNETHASRYIGRNDEYLRRLRLEGRGPPATRVGRQWMRRRSDLDRFMADPDSSA